MYKKKVTILFGAKELVYSNSSQALNPVFDISINGNEVKILHATPTNNPKKESYFRGCPFIYTIE